MHGHSAQSFLYFFFDRQGRHSHGRTEAVGAGTIVRVEVIPDVMSVPRAEVQPILTVRQAACCLGISKTTAYAAAEAGDLPTIRMNGRLVVPTAALRRLLQLDPPVEVEAVS
jgi:excisionase family DNA binding protein